MLIRYLSQHHHQHQLRIIKGILRKPNGKTENGCICPITTFTRSKIFLDHRLTISTQPTALSFKSNPSSSTTLIESKRTFSTSVSKDEVSKFSALASTWYDSSSNPLIGMNPIRLSYIQQILRQHQQLSSENKEDEGEKESKSPLQGLRALDVGCGGGLLSISLANLGAEVVAIDPSKEIVKIAQEYYTRTTKHDKNGNIGFRGGTSVETLANEIHSQHKELFDVVCILEVIEHTTDPKSLLAAASSLLKPDGILFLSTVNQTLKSYGLAIVGAEYITQKVPVGTHSYALFKSPETVRSVMKDVGMEEMDKCGMVVEVTPFMWKDLRWKLDREDLDVNWIGAYVHKDRKDDVVDTSLD